MHLNVTAGVPRPGLHSLFTVECHQRSRAIEEIHLSPLLHSRPFGRSLKNQSRRPCTAAPHYRSHLPTRVFALSSCSVISPSRHLFNCRRLLLSRPVCLLFVFIFLMCSAVNLVLVSLPLSHYCSPMSPPHPLYRVLEGCSLKCVQSSLSDDLFHFIC